MLAFAASTAQASDLALTLPLGLQEQAAWILDDNPLSPEKTALGKQLFWDTRWSRNGTVACVSCHDPNRSPAGSPGRSPARRSYPSRRRPRRRCDADPGRQHAPLHVRLSTCVQ